jgi:hypothetical protein
MASPLGLATEYIGTHSGGEPLFRQTPSCSVKLRDRHLILYIYFYLLPTHHFARTISVYLDPSRLKLFTYYSLSCLYLPRRYHAIRDQPDILHA